MKRLLPVLLLCTAVLFASCARGTSSSEALSQSGASSPASAAPSQSSSSASEEESAVDRMMNALASYQSGTAGSSLKLYVAACELLNFSEDYDSSQEQELRDDFTEYLTLCGDTVRATIEEGRASVDFAAQEILTQGVDAMADLLDEAGCTDLRDSYDAEKYEQVTAILDECLASFSA